MCEKDLFQNVTIKSVIKCCELLKRKGKKSLIKLAQFANVICNNFNV